jgi:hypothetical protein
MHVQSANQKKETAQVATAVASIGAEPAARYKL